MRESEVLTTAQVLGQAKRDWAQAYLMERLKPTNRNAKDAEAAADEAHIREIHEADARYQIALSRIRS